MKGAPSVTDTTVRSGLNEDDGQQAWDVLSDRLEAFIMAWEEETAPAIERFLPSEPPELRAMALVELVKVDLEYRWKPGGQPKRLEDYAKQFDELAGAGMPCDLIYEEYHVRKQAGETIATREYFDRFPHQTAELGRLLGIDKAQTTSALFPVDRVKEFGVGDQVDDFELIGRLGRGAFATVFLARQRSMQRLVALKISSDRGTEPQTMAQLDHPHIVRVFDQRRLPDSKLRLLYMQYVAGGTLQVVADYARQTPESERNGRTLLRAIDLCLEGRGETPPTDSLNRQRLSHLSWSEAICWIGARLAHALDYAHGRGVLHRDVKPANVLISADGSPKLVDFNISFSSKLDGATPAAYFGGSLAYMSPEQLEACNPSHPREAAELDGRIDQYSVAVMLWELLAGRRPFLDNGIRGDWSTTLTSMVEERRRGVDPARLAELPRRLPHGLADVLQTALSPEAEDRYASMGEFARQLELCLQPAAQRLLRPPRRGWRQLVRSFPLTSLLTAGLLPNVVFSVLNFYYNIQDIFGQESQDILTRSRVLLYNGIMYAVAITVCVAAALPVLRAVAALRRGERLNIERQGQLRRRVLVVGDQVTLVIFATWLTSAPIFYFALRDKLDGFEAIHLLTSQTLFGLISVTLTFFMLTFLNVRVLFPALVAPEGRDLRDLEVLLGLGRRVWGYMIIAGATPFLCVIVLVFVSLVTGDNLKTGVLGVLGLGGLISSGLCFWLALSIRNDLGALAGALSPGGDPLSSSEAFDSFLAGTSRRS
ncbi:MAG: serine/threonine protein kinase [Pirellulales bacterium]|nr:serine/threonine protein kinase [Pirellulales bacterium]